MCVRVRALIRVRARGALTPSQARLNAMFVYVCSCMSRRPQTNIQMFVRVCVCVCVFIHTAHLKRDDDKARDLIHHPIVDMTVLTAHLNK